MKKGQSYFLDQMKAFDIIEWEWLEKFLEKFEFGVNFREWVKMLFKNAKRVLLQMDLSLNTSPFHDLSVKGVPSHQCYASCKRSHWYPQ